MSFSKIRVTALITSAALSILAVGCGKTDPNNGAILAQPLYQYGDACPVGAYNIYGRGCYAGTFDGACMYSGGQAYTDNGVRVCKFTTVLGASYSSYALPRLNENYPNDPSAPSLSFVVYAGDRVTGTAGSTSYYKCDGVQYNLDGVKSGDTSATVIGSLPAGLVVSDSSQVYFVGTSSSSNVAHSGVLHIGLNAPLCYSSTSYKLVNVGAIVTHCEDANRVTYPCL